MRQLTVGVDIPLPTSIPSIKVYHRLPKHAQLGQIFYLSNTMSQQNVYRSNRLIGYWVNRAGDYTFEPCPTVEAPRMHTCDLCNTEICEVDTMMSIEQPCNYAMSHPTLCPACELREEEYKLEEYYAS